MLRNLDIKTLQHFFNILGLAGVFLMLFFAFGFQIILHELPCPLCLLQRLGFLGVALGFLMNLRFGLRPSHYAISLLSALFTGFVALRQIALHVIPGTGSYGDPFFGFHLYTWSFIFSMIIVIVTTVMLGIDKQYDRTINTMEFPRTTHILFAVLVLLIAANVISILFECGLAECPDNPTHYKIEKQA